MELVVDKLGRVVIPKKVREHLHLHPGVRLRLREEGEGFYLEALHEDPPLAEENGVLVIGAPGAETVSAQDVAAILTRERDGRLRP